MPVGRVSPALMWRYDGLVNSLSKPLTNLVYDVLLVRQPRNRLPKPSVVSRRAYPGIGGDGAVVVDVKLVHVVMRNGRQQDV